ncbi:MAG: 3'-5' exoribonuclease [Abditibacteriota bacterium]|nr:3'-5' exoribonuclease [Abditibacteriota bacterium]
MNKIVAIDFETANISTASAISIGYAVIIDNLIVDYNNYLIKPHYTVGEFLPQNIRIHHITPKMVEHAPSFKEIYEAKLKEIFKDAYLVAHNAPFDMRVLKSLFGLYYMEVPNWKYCCTVELSTHLWPNIPGHRLPVVAEAINYNLSNHHDAKYDALACAKIITAAMKDLDTTKFEGLCFMTKTKIGTILNTKDKGWNDLRHYKPDLNNLIKWTDGDYKCHPYFNKKIAKIGELKDMSPENMAGHLCNIGGIFHEFILGDTDLVVLSDKYYDKYKEALTSIIFKLKVPGVILSKINKARELKKLIISETEFKEELFAYGYMDNKTGIPKYMPYQYM